MLGLSLKKLRAIAKIRGIKDYKSMSKDKLLSILDKSKQVKKTKAIRDIRKENFNSDKILRDIITLYETEEEDYYEPVRTSNAFSINYIEYESNGDQDKILSVKEYLDMIRQYLSNIINDHKRFKMNGKFNQHWKSVLFLLTILMELVLCIQQVIT